jgi:hypothetical protein
VPELVHVSTIEVMGDHRLRVTFDDDASGEIDASKWEWRGVFEPLKNPEFFSRARLDAELGTVVWPNGADIAPETLHATLLEQSRRGSA